MPKPKQIKNLWQLKEFLELIIDPTKKDWLTNVKAWPIGSNPDNTTLTIEQIVVILTDKTKVSWQTNIEIDQQLLQELFDNTKSPIIHNERLTIFGIIKIMDLFNTLTSFQAMQPNKPRDSKPPKWFVEFEKKINARFDKIEIRLDQHDTRFDKIEARLDEHDKMLKAHGWIK